MDRRVFIRTAAAGAAALSTLQLASCGGGGDAVDLVVDPGPEPAGTGPDLLMANGRIHTMDDAGTVLSSIGVRNGRFIAASDIKRSEARVIDLQGRTVVPGLIESHTHFVSLANRPGYHVAEWELASNIAGALAAIKARRDKGVPEGQFITAMGAGTPTMFAEARLPNLAEIDSAVSDRPVFLYQSGFGPATANTLAKQFFESQTTPAGAITINADGTMTGAMANRCLYVLRIRQTFEDKKRSALDAMAYSASVGVTAVLDQVLPAKATGTLDPSTLEPQPTDALFNLNHFRMYDGWLALHQEDKQLIRLQMNFLHNQSYIAALGPITEMHKQLPELRERLKNSQPFFGDEWLRTGGIGEWAAPFALSTGNADNYAVWLESQRLVAKARWRNENAQAGTGTGGPALEQVIATYEQMDAEFGIKDLRWGLQHGDNASPAQFARLKALNCGVSISGFRGMTRSANIISTRFADALASGVQLGMHMDGVHIAPHNPWFGLYYATTGLNLNGVMINPGQQITRQQALRLYTRGNAWYLNREHDLGSIEAGKLADLVVLDRDYFTVSDAEMRQTRPVFTVVGGKVVHDTGALA